VHPDLRTRLPHLGSMSCSLPAVKQLKALDGFAFDPFSFDGE
jgi:hypothetical protein